MKKLTIEYRNSVFSLPRDAVLSGLAGANELAMRVLLAVTADHRLCDDLDSFQKELCARFDCTPSALAKAIAYWEEKGVWHSDEPSAAPEEKPKKKELISSELPTYSESEAAAVLEKSDDLPCVIDMCQQIVGKIMTPAEISIVVGLYDHLRLEGEYIVNLFGYCRKLGKTSVRYIEKTALSLSDEGIDTVTALNEYIKRRESLSEKMTQLCSKMGIGGRALSTKEKKTFEEWITSYDYDLIEKAYDITVDNTGKNALPYMNKVLQNWSDAGLKTLADVEASLASYQQKKATAEQNQAAFETDEFFEAALKRSFQGLKN